MNSVVTLESHSGVAAIVIDNPPVNALDKTVRAGILHALKRAQADKSISKIVIAARGDTFPAGADIREFDEEPVEPSLADLCDLIEACPKPVIAVLQGTALGGGLELAMAAHYRIAHVNARLGLPEIRLGLVPFAGGTQRAPRLIGADQALQLIVSGKAISGQRAYRVGLVDMIAKDDLWDAVIHLIFSVDRPRPTRDLRKMLANGAEYKKVVARYREKQELSKGTAFAASKIIDCVEAALLLPFEGGLALEQSAFRDCYESPASVGLRHAFFAERKAIRFPELAKVSARPLGNVAIVGDDRKAAPIAVSLLKAGLAVTFVETDKKRVSVTLDRIGSKFHRAVRRGEMSEDGGVEALSKLRMTADPKVLTKADLIIEAMPEGLDIKGKTLNKIAAIAKPGSVLASSVSTLNIDDLAQASGRGGDLVGMNFIDPVRKMRLVELVVSRTSSKSAVATVHRLARILGKMPIHSGAGEGVIASRMFGALRRVADHLMEQGVMPAQIDATLRAFGFERGVYEIVDRVGLSVSVSTPESRAIIRSESRLAIERKLSDVGSAGFDAGRGYYVYDAAGNQTGPNPQVEALIKSVWDKKGIRPRKLSAQEISDRILLGLINEGARLVGERVAQRPSDIDALMVHGFGYPRHRGGPMLDADIITPHEVISRIEVFAREDADLWQVSPLLQALARERMKFADINRI